MGNTSDQWLEDYKSIDDYWRYAGSGEEGWDPLRRPCGIESYSLDNQEYWFEHVTPESPYQVAQFWQIIEECKAPPNVLVRTWVKHGMKFAYLPRGRSVGSDCHAWTDDTIVFCKSNKPLK
jgi:hypothetical protein